MAGIAVQLLLERLTSLSAEERELLGGVGVGRDVDDIKNDLESMRSFLQDADLRGETDQRVKTWVKQVRDVAYDTEDVLDEVLLRLVRPRKQGIFDSLLTRNLFAIRIQDINARLKAISERRQAFSFTDRGERINRANTTSPNASLYIDEAEVVGIQVPKNNLIRWLTEGELKLTIISVVGMGGLGKTTLVKKVYDSKMVNQHFDFRVWITVSKSPVIGELMRTTIKGVLKATEEQAPEGMDAMDNHELIEVLNKQLWEKRYAVIFDDIRDINVWEAMKFAFPNCDCGSRIIFTTRTSEVAACCSYVHDLEPLNEQEAWRLFCMKAFGSSHDSSSSSCPEELEELSRNILKKCSGLPLAIVLIGGLLGRKAKTILEWKYVHDSVGAKIRNNYDLSWILLLSYNNLPYYLKPCFLYLSMFPEDYFINRMKLIRLWIAEGFVEEKKGVTMEDMAGDYVNELISRSMIQIAELNQCGEVKSCRIHDLMRETIQSKAKEECFSTTIITGSHGMGDDSFHEKARRISIHHNSTGDQNDSYSMGWRCSNIRSLMMFQLDESPPARSFGDKLLFRALRLLRVLDLEGAGLVEFPPELVELINLRYLSLRRNTKITVLPKSVGKLKNLATLDLKHTGVSELPNEILKLQSLRHLLVYPYRVSLPKGIGSLTCLQQLTLVDVGHQAAGNSGGVVVMEELGKLTQLRRLGIAYLRSKDGRDLCFCLVNMKHLHCLNIIARVIARSTTTVADVHEVEEEFLELESLMSSPPQLLRHLCLNGRLKRLPVWIASLRNLAILKLRYSRLSCEEGNDPLKAFQHMPNLVDLYLEQAYDGEELCCNEVGGYQNLKILLLQKMEGLKRVRFMEGSMLMLRKLDIDICPAMEMVPQGIQHLSSLQELNLYRVHPVLVERIRKRRPRSPPSPQGGEAQGEDCWKVQHIPTIKHYYLDVTHGRFTYEYLQ